MKDSDARAEPLLQAGPGLFHPFVVLEGMRTEVPLVSVIIPARDEEGWIARAVRSVLDGALREVEVVVCLDRCSDGTEDVLRGLGDRRVVWVRNPGPPGISGALNAAAAAASADLLARLDADDVQEPDRLRLQVDHLLRDRLDVCIGWARLLDADGTELVLQTSPTGSEEIRRGLRRANVIVHSTVLMRRQALLGSGGYRRTRWEDYDLWVRLSGRGCRFGGVPAVVVSRTWRRDGLAETGGRSLGGRLDVLRHRVRAARAAGGRAPR
jgi:glycosyltransferase involved in cell wall biosynthesis